ncbi:MAG: hypothetical protein ACRD3Q_08210 [Terriglobales bacterium]
MPGRHELLRAARPDGRALVLSLNFPADSESDLEFCAAHELADGSGAEQAGLVRLPGSAVVLLLERLKAEVAQSPSRDPEAALVEGVTALISREDPDLWTICRTITAWCDRAGASHELMAVDHSGKVRRLSRKHFFLWNSGAAATGGRVSTLAVRFRPGHAADQSGLVFCEEYRSVGDPDYEYTTSMGYSSLADLAALLRDKAELPDAEDRSPEDTFIASVAALVMRGELGTGLGQAGSRDRLAAWCAEAGIAHLTGGTHRRETLLVDAAAVDGHTLELTLTFWAPYRHVLFVESRMPLDGSSDGFQFEVKTSHESVEPLVDRLESSLGASPAPFGTDLDDRLVACLIAMVDRGELGRGLRPGENRDRVADWYAGLGLPSEKLSFGPKREVNLVREYRERTDSIFSLSLTFHSDWRSRGISFSERYDYLARAGDAGREYAYSTCAPYDSLETLVSFFESRLGTTQTAPDDRPEDRLVSCFATLVERGELSAELAIKENHERVAAWYAEAGVPVDTESWSWFND